MGVGKVKERKNKENLGEKVWKTPVLLNETIEAYAGERTHIQIRPTDLPSYYSLSIVMPDG